MALSPETRAAVRRYGPSVNPLARARYGISGQDLLAKLVWGESRDNPNAVSSAGARGRTQFIPSTRRAIIAKYGIDPWGTADEAVHAASLYLRGRLGNPKGLEGYNPGSPSYPDYILGQKVRGPGGRGGGGVNPSALPGATAASLSPGPDVTGLLGQLLGRQQQPVASGGVQPAAYAAHATLPQGYRGIVSSGGPGPRRDLSSILEAAQALGGPNTGLGSPGVPGDAQNGGAGIEGGSRKGRGRVVLSPGADRAGVPTGADVLNFASQVSAIARMPLRIGTGSNHSRLTASGRVSDHWRGEAADIPASGRRLLRIGRAALIAAGMDPAQARRARGGLYNLGGWQIIFAVDGAGVGNHFDHLHIGRRR